jgi:hypothetical protein
MALGVTVSAVVCVIVLLGYFLVAVGAARLLRIPDEQFLIPEGYQGDVCVVFGIPSAEGVVPWDSGLTYRIPADGVLFVRNPIRLGSKRFEYDYARKDVRYCKAEICG